MGGGPKGGAQSARPSPLAQSARLWRWRLGHQRLGRGRLGRGQLGREKLGQLQLRLVCLATASGSSSAPPCVPNDQPTSKGTTRDDGGQRARGLREHERASNARASHTMRRARAYGERRRRGAGRGCRATCKVIARSHGEACRGEAGWRGRDARLRLRRRACCKGSRSAPPSCLRSVGASPSAGLAQLLLLRRLPATRRSSDAPLSAIRLSPPPRCHSDAPPSPPSALARPRQPPPATSLPFCIFPCLACQKAAKNGEIEPRGQRLHQRESRSSVVTK